MKNPMPPGETRPRGARAVLLRPFERFFALESASGILLLASAAAALAWANSPWGASYFHLWELRFGPGAVGLNKTLHHWINDGLMAVFFFVVGLELKREVLSGELASVRRASLPIAAAIGGMVVPAAIYAVLNRGTPGMPGWGIPMATDIAFALGVIALLGPRVPLALRVFVTAVAIVDDLGAVLVIALFYTAELSSSALAWGSGALLMLGILNVAGVRRLLPYLVLGVLLWIAVLESGVHATIAGVLLALTIPATHGTPDEHGGRPDRSPLVRLEHALHPYVAYGIVPIFALANAGVSLSGDLAATFTSTVASGVLLGLLVGKPVGILLMSWLAVRTGLASLPGGVGWRQVGGVATLCGIGFTMSLFIASLAFDPVPALLDQAKIGILAASLLAGIAGALLLSKRAR